MLVIMFSMETLLRGEWLLFLFVVLLTVVLFFLSILLGDKAIKKQLGDTESKGSITNQLDKTQETVIFEANRTKEQIDKTENTILHRIGNDEQGSIAYRLNKISSGMEELKETKRKVEELGKNEQELFFAMEKMKHNYLDVQLENIRLKEKVREQEKEIEYYKEKCHELEKKERQRNRDWELER